MGPRGLAGATEKRANKPKRNVQFTPPPEQPPPPDARTLAKLATIEANLKTKARILT